MASPLITINGVVLSPTPAEYQVGIQDISNANRNAKGTMIIERIATKRTIQVKWNYLLGGDIEVVLSTVAGVQFPVTYLDPQTMGQRTADFYCGDRAISMIDYINGVPRYKDVSFTLIEI